MTVDHQLPIPPGDRVPSREVPFPPHAPIKGSYAHLVPLHLDHTASLFKHIGGQDNATLWTFIPLEPPLIPPLTETDAEALVRKWTASKDPQYYAVLDEKGEALGVLSYLNIVPTHRRIEIGWIVLGKALQKTRVATDMFYLLMKRVFELGYQRVEWKANSLNKPSLAAAERLGFTYEGLFRKHVISSGVRRDTSWFSITDDEWSGAQKGFEAWLDEGNFDQEGKQKRGLRECREE
ncbi:uncharacterized protein J7T54_004176 [Emericellopsis cladophorae]|uniref:N-acetyltransferase domain-containing protein n=1 Tax=Emericellopsis cladophorae TaxID=2686198 RepID=A0A9P9XUX6_9HYPO|nr:uncharacterized protein J7T54_004176 [Emericellopsis cladophorae]KAI6778269.1 hypothetical protein J7T54_004176 [Emericellopsis cladophorae]